MTKGIRVNWRPAADGKREATPYEIEYFCGIDVNHLDQPPEFTTVPAVWPRYEGGASGVYTVNAHYDRQVPGEVRLVVKYTSENNPELVRRWGEDEFSWGTNVIVLKPGQQSGSCEWRPDSDIDNPEGTWTWEAFDLGVGCERPRAEYRGSKREAWFRSVILERDAYRCVITGEATVQALEAAHLIPAANGQNDVPLNGITLRADLHRLFDAGLFTLSPNGRVKLHRQLREGYRSLLRRRRLPKPTLERVRATLAHPQFKDRPLAR